MSIERFDALVRETAALTEEFVRAGRSVFLVGGIVRDTLLGRVRAELDIDLTTDALPDEIEQIVQRCRPTALWTQGKRFGTIGATIKGPNGPRAVEITTHRAEMYHDQSRKPDVRFSTDINLDLSRRDFTVNAMAFDLRNPGLLDPFGGQRDLDARVLRTPLSPEISFSDDPLRMLRAARFIAGLGLTADPLLHDAVVSHGHRMSIVSAERIRGELVKLLTLGDPAPGLRFLTSTNLVRVFLPELSDGLVERAIARIAGLGAHETTWLLRLTALLWDAFTTESAVRARLRALKCSSEEMVTVGKMFRLKSLDLSAAASADSATRRFVLSAGSDRTAFLAVVRADTGTVPTGVLDALEYRIAALSQSEDLGELTPEIDGEAVMAMLGLPPGRVVGEALAMLLDVRLDEGVVGPEEAERRVRQWWERRNSVA